MKTKTLILTTLFFALFSTTLFAANNPTVDAANKVAISSAVQEAMTFPEFAEAPDYKGLAYFSFSIAPSGKIRVNSINASDPNLKSHVLENLAKLTFNHHPGSNDQEYVYKFSFQRK